MERKLVEAGLLAMLPLFPPEFWLRNFFEHPPSAAGLRPDFEESFPQGKASYFGRREIGP